MKGFQEFLLRGNLVELAVAFVIGAAFATVVSEFTKLLIAIVSALVGGPPQVGRIAIGGVPFGPFLNGLIAFVFLAAILYFLVMLPYQKFQRRKKVEEPDKAASTEDLLTEIRDLLASR